MALLCGVPVGVSKGENLSFHGKGKDVECCLNFFLVNSMYPAETFIW